MIMYKFDNELLKSEERSVFFSLCTFLGFIALGFVAGYFVGFLLAIPFFEGGLEEMQQIFQSSPEIIKDHSLAFLIMQGGMAIMFFIVFPLLYIYFIDVVLSLPIYLHLYK